MLTGRKSYPARLKYCTPVPRFLRLPDLGAFFRELRRYSPDLSFRIMHPMRASESPKILNLCRIRMDPWRAVRTLEQPVGLFIANDALLSRVPGQSSVQLHRDIREDAARRGNIRLLDIGDGFGAGVDRREKIL